MRTRSKTAGGRWWLRGLAGASTLLAATLGFTTVANAVTSNSECSGEWCSIYLTSDDHTRDLGQVTASTLPPDSWWDFMVCDRVVDRHTVNGYVWADGHQITYPSPGNGKGCRTYRLYYFDPHTDLFALGWGNEYRSRWRHAY